MSVIIKDKTGGILTIEKEDGTTFTLTEDEAWNLKILLQLEDLKVDIHELVEELDGEWIALGSYDGTPEEFEAEVYECLSGDVEYGRYPSGEYIEEVIRDTARTYGIEID